MPTARSAALAILTIALTSLPGCSRSVQNTEPGQPEAGRLKPIPAFDRQAAFDLLENQVRIGPRYPGSAGHKAAAKLIESQLRQSADRITIQDFTRQVGDRKLDLRNIIGYFNPRARWWLLLAAHWDTRPTADMEVTTEKRRQPIVGANDGASGVAVLLELARMFSIQKPNVGVIMVFFDGEDYGPTVSDMFLGSEYFARNLKAVVPGGDHKRIRYGILLDMVGDMNLALHPEAHSMDAAPDVVRKVWAMGSHLGYGKHFPTDPRPAILDDHVPLIAAGLQCIDVIDFEYAPWHTLEDTVDKCSPRSLGIVGEVIAHVVYEEKSQ